MDVDKLRAETLQLGDGHGLVVDPGARATLARHGPPDRHTFRSTSTFSLHLEVGLDFGFPGAVADDGRVRPPAENESKRAHEDGLSRAGLARDDVQSWTELRLGAFNNRKVQNSESLEHFR